VILSKGWIFKTFFLKNVKFGLLGKNL